MSNMNYFKLLKLKTFKIAVPFKLLQPSDTPLQIIGPHFGEEKIFKLAYALEKEAKVSTLAEI